MEYPNQEKKMPIGASTRDLLTIVGGVAAALCGSAIVWGPGGVLVFGGLLMIVFTLVKCFVDHPQP